MPKRMALVMNTTTPLPVPDQLVPGTNIKIMPENKQWLAHIIHHIRGFHNETEDFTTPHLRASVASFYFVFVLLYALLIGVGVVLNLAVLTAVIVRKLHRRTTCCLLANLAVAHVMQCLVVLPLSLSVLLLQNWVYGPYLCFMIPMVQDLTLHVSMMSHLFIAGDRYRFLRDPTKQSLPALPLACITWLLAVCIVLPYPAFMTYLDLGSMLSEHFEGVGMCIVNLAEDMHEYTGTLFVLMYALPLAVIAFLHIRVSSELKRQEGPVAIMVFEARAKEAASAGSTAPNPTPAAGAAHDSRFAEENPVCSFQRSNHEHDLYEAELEIVKEKRTHKYLVKIVTIFAIFLGPLMVLKLAKQAFPETYENAAMFDVTFTVFVWIAFVPTCTTPFLVASWMMALPAWKHRLLNFFRFSNRKLPRSCGGRSSTSSQQQIPVGGHHLPAPVPVGVAVHPSPEPVYVVGGRAKSYTCQSGPGQSAHLGLHCGDMSSFHNVDLSPQNIGSLQK